jgi:hypothetical protein
VIFLKYEDTIYEPFIDRVEQIRKDSYPEDNKVVFNDALEIGLTILEASTKDIDRTKFSIFRNFGRPEKVREFYLQDLEQIICSFDREKLEDYTLQEIEDLHNLLLDEGRNTKEIEFEAERKDGDPLCP